jgi:hypothetical protein
MARLLRMAGGVMVNEGAKEAGQAWRSARSVNVDCRNV